MSFKSRMKELAHWHRFTTLLIYPPHNHVCDREQCKENDDYGFLLRCDCGHTKLTKLPNGIKEFFEVRSKHNKSLDLTLKSQRKSA